VSRTTLSAAAALLLAPALAIIGVLIQPTMSDEAAHQFAALADHRGATIAGLVLGTVSAALLIAGVIWLASAVGPRAARLARAGGVLAVFGLLVVIFENGIAAAAPSVVNGLDPARAIAALDRVNNSAAVSSLEPLAIIGDLGLAILGVAVVRSGAPRWTALAMALGAFGQGIGFATASRGLVIAGFAVLLAGLAQAVRTLVVPAHRWYHRETLEEGSGGAASKRLFQL